jgi:hypothetical protein
MLPLLSYLRKQLWLFQFYQFTIYLAFSVFIFCSLFQFGFFSRYILEAFAGLSGFAPNFFWFSVGVGFVLAFSFLFLQSVRILNLKTSDVATEIEKQNFYFQENSNRKGELRTASFFLEGASETASEEFQNAHLNVWNRRLSKFRKILSPDRKFYTALAVIAVAFYYSHSIQNNFIRSFPEAIHPWTPTQFEFRLPFEDAEWKIESGALSGVAGTKTRFKAPSFRLGFLLLHTFIYVRELNQKNWTAYPCAENCELTLKERGEYAVGSQFSRSTIFPLQVVPDELPKGVVMVKVDEEWVPSATIDVLNKKDLNFQLAASDDILLTKVELHHRFEDSDQVVEKWSLKENHFKSEITLPLEGWKGGHHEVFLKLFDVTQNATSAAVTIIFADENTLREKRLQNLRSLLDEWVHVLADLLDSNQDQKLADGLIKRLQQIEYAEDGESPLINAFTKELRSLGQRIENWARFSPNFSESKSLIQKTEKTLLYGLSLLFQEKTGEIQSTTDALHASQNDLNKLLEKIKDGKMELNSKELEEAFQKLAAQLEEMQKKIRDLPQGPQDDLINREAMEAQAEESQNLAKRIEDIKKQVASGDNKGAMRELESLLNQLSILSKEMEHSLDQWKNNLDQGALQSSERFGKKLEELQKRQEDLAKRTEKLKDKSEKLEAESQKKWQPIEPEKLKKLKKEYSELGKEQEKISGDLKNSIDKFDKEVEGSEWQQLLRSEQMQEMENQISDKMQESKDALSEEKSFESLGSQREAIELMTKAQNAQKQMRQNAESASKGGGLASGPQSKSEKIEIKGTEKQGEKERRRKIMDSLRQKVDEKFQKSHEQYFEDLLQR